MSLQNGIELAGETILRLSNDNNSVDKLHQAWSEIAVMGDDDTSEDWFEEVTLWKEKYLVHSAEIQSAEYYEELINELKFICGAIIAENRRLIPEDEQF